MGRWMVWPADHRSVQAPQRDSVVSPSTLRGLLSLLDLIMPWHLLIHYAMSRKPSENAYIPHTYIILAPPALGIAIS